MTRKMLKIISSLGIFTFLFNAMQYSELFAASNQKEFLDAVQHKNYARIERLLEEGADINAVYSKDQQVTPLALASSLGDIMLVDYLLKHGADARGPKEFPNESIFMAISGNHSQIVNRFLDIGISPNYAWSNKNGGTLLIAAVQFGKKRIVKLLVKRGADVNFIGNSDHSPLYRSIIYDHFAIFNFLLEHGAKLNKNDKQALEELKWFDVDKGKKYLRLLKKSEKISD